MFYAKLSIIVGAVLMSGLFAMATLDTALAIMAGL